MADPILTESWGRRTLPVGAVMVSAIKDLPGHFSFKVITRITTSLAISAVAAASVVAAADVAVSLAKVERSAGPRDESIM